MDNYRQIYEYTKSNKNTNSKAKNIDTLRNSKLYKNSVNFPNASYIKDLSNNKSDFPKNDFMKENKLKNKQINLDSPKITNKTTSNKIYFLTQI